MTKEHSVYRLATMKGPEVWKLAVQPEGTMKRIWRWAFQPVETRGLKILLVRRLKAKELEARRIAARTRNLRNSEAGCILQTRDLSTRGGDSWLGVDPLIERSKLGEAGTPQGECVSLSVVGS